MSTDDQREALADAIRQALTGRVILDGVQHRPSEATVDRVVAAVLAARPSAPTVTTEQRVALARSCGVVRVGADSVPFYERQAGSMWNTFLADADRHLAALRIEVQP
jgi:hypothetical protein